MRNFPSISSFLISSSSLYLLKITHYEAPHVISPASYNFVSPDAIISSVPLAQTPLIYFLLLGQGANYRAGAVLL
jgi:hypothetical protein